MHIDIGEQIASILAKECKMRHFPSSCSVLTHYTRYRRVIYTCEGALYILALIDPPNAPIDEQARFRRYLKRML